MVMWLGIQSIAHSAPWVWLEDDRSKQHVARDASNCDGVDRSQCLPADTVEEPARIRAKVPRYPALARLLDSEGYVHLTFEVTPHGTVVSRQIVTANAAWLFEEPAIVAVSTWTTTRSPTKVIQRSSN